MNRKSYVYISSKPDADDGYLPSADRDDLLTLVEWELEQARSPRQVQRLLAEHAELVSA